MPDAATLQAISIITTVVLAFVGYMVTYFNNIRIENRKAQVKFVSDQVQYLYGPLFSLSHASDQAWIAFRSRCRPGGSFFGDPRKPPPTPQELEQWRLWMSEVFMPINLNMEEAIIQHAHLIEEETMPKSFLALLAHVEVYKAVIKGWQSGDFSQHTSYLNFPESFRNNVTKTFETLKHRQFELIGKA